MIDSTKLKKLYQKFNCYFDDEDEFREMILHYYLSDDTLEIREVMRPNSGRDAVPIFVKRAKLPKNAQARDYESFELIYVIFSKISNLRFKLF